jgi:uroporphyrinogen III methyltransferase/synthase
LKPGKVYLVGAGPGDPGLLTLRGAECIRRADVVVYDRLAHPDLLLHASTTAEKVYVGKKSAQHTLRQEEINTLIVEHALSGKTVCRLKGGDPLVFGRGGEEAEACVAAGVPFEFVPGVTSAIAAPAYAGIPVTHRDASSSLAVITGHERDDRGEAGTREAGAAEQRRDWSKIAYAADTLIFLMGVESISEIAARLIEHGRAGDTPVALVRWGTWPRQETLVSTLEQVGDDVRKAGFTAPAVTVVGEVVRYREALRWFDNRPLFGKRVVVTRAREQASALSGLLRERGAEPIEFPTIRIVPMEDYSCLDAALLDLGKYDWIIFTSANGVTSTFDRLRTAGKDARALAGARVAAIGPATADALRANGVTADFVPSRYVAESVAEEWPDRDMTGKRILLPRAKEAREFLPDHLREMGAQVDVVAAYQTVRDESGSREMVELLSERKIDAVTFTSSSTVSNFVESLGAERTPELMRGVTVACIGPITADTARELDLEPRIVADEFTVEGLVDALTQSMTGQGSTPNKNEI